MIIAFYYRVSLRDKMRGISLDVQREVCQRWVNTHSDPAIRNAMTLPPYEDDSKSAFTENIAKRPAFKKLIQDAEAKKFDMVVVYKFDRFARKRHVYFRYIDELREHYNIPVKSATESDDWLTVGITGLLSEQYSRMLSDRMRDVKRHEASERARWVGAIPFGYNRIDGKLIPNDHAWIVKTIFDLFATNSYSMMDIVDELQARGITRRSAYHNDGEPYSFGQQSIRQILSNRVYLGEVRCGDISVPNAHEALVSTEMWNTVQEIRDRRSTHGGRITIKAADRGVLTGVARCAVCGSAMWYSKTGKGWRSYNCSRRVRYHACESSPAHTVDVDRYVLHLLSRLKLPSDWQKQAVDIVAAEQRQQLPPDAVLFERESRKLRSLFLDGQIDIDEYRVRDARLKAAQTPSSQISLPVLSLAAERLNGLSTLISQSTVDEQRALVSTIFERIWLRASTIEAWTPRAAYMPLFRLLYGEQIENSWGTPSR